MHVFAKGESSSGRMQVGSQLNTQLVFHLSLEDCVQCCQMMPAPHTLLAGRIQVHSLSHPREGAQSQANQVRDSPSQGHLTEFLAQPGLNQRLEPAWKRAGHRQPPRAPQHLFAQTKRCVPSTLAARVLHLCLFFSLGGGGGAQQEPALFTLENVPAWSPPQLPKANRQVAIEKPDPRSLPSPDTTLTADPERAENCQQQTWQGRSCSQARPGHSCLLGTKRAEAAQGTLLPAGADPLKT